jgi:hypothetical protein
MIAVVNISESYESQGEPSMRFEAQTITVQDQYKIAHPLSAMVGVQEDGTPTGLAYHLGVHSMTHTPILYEDWYSLTHLVSGLRVGRDAAVMDEATVRRWLELIAPLTDWTQPAEAIKQQVSLLRGQVEAARQQACEEQERKEVFSRTPSGGVVQEK